MSISIENLIKYKDITQQVDQINNMPAEEYPKHYKRDFDTLIFRLANVSGSTYYATQTKVDAVLQAYCDQKGLKVVEKILIRAGQLWGAKGWDVEIDRKWYEKFERFTG